MKIVFPLNNVFPDNLKPDKTGLVALGGQLSPMIIIEAYSKGIFPWAGSNPIPWYSPDPRLILIPKEFHISRTLKKKIKKNQYRITFDNNFSSVINTCAQIIRKHQKGTWIDDNIIRAYSELFDLNIAHSIEIYLHDELCGGLYGLSLGKTFFGESMFSRLPDGSKIALYFLTKKLISLDIHLIDCQQSTPHMLSLGAKEVSRKRFLKLIKDSLHDGINIQKW